MESPHLSSALSDWLLDPVEDWELANRILQDVRTSNGKSSIVEERLYSFFFAFFSSFFLFYTITNEDFRLLRSCKNFKRFILHCFVFTNSFYL
jgi:hypothetical protein